MPEEIERKFLVAGAPEWLGEFPALRIEQGYLAIGERDEVRLRRADGLLTLTAKEGQGEVRGEAEVSLDRSRFESLWGLTEGRRLTKTRHLVPLEDDLRAEVDVYGGDLEGLLTVEVEFGSRAASGSFQPPDWFGEELTGDPRYSNQSLAGSGLQALDPAGNGNREGVAADPKSRKYRLKRGESAAAGIRRVVRGRAEKAVERLRGSGEGDVAEAVHGARKDLKKVRSALRLARAGLDKEDFRAENHRYRDAGRLLAESRDAKVKLATLMALEQRFGQEFPVANSLAWTEALEADRRRGAGPAGEASAETIATAIEAIEAGGKRISSWDLEGDSWELIEPGLLRTYRDGRDALAGAREERDAAAVHQFRKRAKDLWHQLRLLHDAWPALLAATSDQAHQLSELLGDHHDLAVLAEDLEARAGTVVEGDVFAALIALRQAELLEGAIALGERLYAEKPQHFGRRLHGYWRAWRA